jgi:hypothetical protein
VLHDCVDAHVAIWVQCVEVCLKPRPRTFNRYFADWDDFAADLGYRSPGEIDIDWGSYTATSKRRSGATTTQQRLVDVVVENFTKPSLIFLTQIA